MSALEQVVGFPTRVFKEADNEVDEVIERSLLVGLPDAAIDYGWQLVAGGHLSGLKLCKLLYELTEMWPRFNTDDDIRDAIFKGMGVPPETYRKYEGLWRAIFANENIDKRYREAMRNKPIRGLIAITAAARDDEFNEDHWGKLVAAHDISSMLAVRDEARHIERDNSERLTITLERDGRLVAHRDGEQEGVGYLAVGAGVELVQVAVRRIISAAGIVER